MQLTKHSLLPLLFSFILICTEVFVQIKQHPLNKDAKPDLEKIITLHPLGWKAIPGSSVDPSTQTTSYDQVATQIYKRLDGKAVSIVLTWSRDGFNRAGHPQEICYNSQGFTVSALRNISFLISGQKFDVVTFSGRYRDMIEDVIYWRVTGEIHDATLKENISQAHRAKEVAQILIGNIPSNLMVRVSTWRTPNDPPSTVHIDYIKSYLQFLPPKTRHFLTGL